MISSSVVQGFIWFLNSKIKENCVEFWCCGFDIEGATSGIGAETARVMAKRGVRVIIPARDLKKAGEMKERIQKESPKAEVIVLEIDLSSFASIKRFCSEFLSLGLPLHILMWVMSHHSPFMSHFSDEYFFSSDVLTSLYIKDINKGDQDIKIQTN